MTSLSRFLQYRAPRESGQTLVVPTWHQLESLLATNRQQRVEQRTEFAGCQWSDLASQAQKEMREAATQYTQTYTNSAMEHAADVPIILTGHQPELVHPGVWLKNFAAARLAKQVGGMAIHLIIDSDLCRRASIDVPTDDRSTPRSEKIFYDRNGSAQPYEERAILDRNTWNQFGNKVTRTIRSLVGEPLISDWWPRHAARPDLAGNLGLSMSQARHRLEIDWGVKNWELPLSKVCQTVDFRRFAIHLLRLATSFRTIYNNALAEYRTAHGIRNHARPLRDLTSEAPWIETPFWFWTNRQPQRRALYVHVKPNELVLTDRYHWQERLPLTSEGDLNLALEQWQQWEEQGIKVRTRALTTTMYARLMLSDLFIHGIGGAKYDQITDRICERFFGFAPPAYAALSGTLRLPIEHPSVDPYEERHLSRQLRELRYHPETALSGLSLNSSESEKVEQLLALKSHWIKTDKTSRNAKERHRHIEGANIALQPWLRSQKKQIERQLAKLQKQQQANNILDSREHPFCLFPQNHLRDFLLDFTSSLA